MQQVMDLISDKFCFGPESYEMDRSSIILRRFIPCNCRFDRWIYISRLFRSPAVSTGCVIKVRDDDIMSQQAIYPHE